MTNSAELMNQGMQILLAQLGHVRAEEFISLVIREKFDYTKWQHTLFDGMTVNELNKLAAESETAR